MLYVHVRSADQSCQLFLQVICQIQKVNKERKMIRNIRIRKRIRKNRV